MTSSLVTPINKFHYQNINSQSQLHLCIHEPIDTVWQPANRQNALSLHGISKVHVTLILTSTNSLMLLFLNIWEIISAVSPKRKGRGGGGGWGAAGKKIATK